MPKASMYEDDCLVLGENDVGRTRKISAMQAKAIAETVKDLPDRQLRFRVPPFYRGHVPASHRGNRMLITGMLPAFSHYQTVS